MDIKLNGDSASGTPKCVEFTYGGCQGNGNRFDSKIDCEMTCMGQGVGEPPKGPMQREPSSGKVLHRLIISSFYNFSEMGKVSTIFLTYFSSNF